MISEFSSHDCDELSESLVNTQQVFRQLRSGEFFGEWRLLELPGVTFVDDRISHGIYNAATIPEGFEVAFVPLKQLGSLVVEGSSCDDSCIFLAQSGTRLELAIPSDFRSYTIEFDRHYVRRTATSLGIALPPKTADLQQIRNNAAHTAAAKLVARAYCTVADCSHKTSQHRADLFMTSWLNLLRQTAGQPKAMDRSTLSQRRRAALDVADYINANLSEHLSVADLCEVAGVTDRTLRSGFHEVFGVSPNRWVKAQRLSAARRELKAADPKHENVRSIAVRHGFAQFAHFAIDYRKHFGERPSETLRS